MDAGETDAVKGRGMRQGGTVSASDRSYTGSHCNAANHQMWTWIE